MAWPAPSFFLAAVALLATLVVADTELTKSYSLSGATYSSFTYTISENIPRQREPVDVILSASNVTGGGLVLMGWTDNSEEGMYAFTMSMTNFFLDDSTFIVRDGIPADGILTIQSLQAINAASQVSPFDFSALYFTHNLTLSITNTFIMMEEESANLPIIVAGSSTSSGSGSAFDYYTAVQIASLRSTGGSYVLQLSGSTSAQEFTTITNHALVSLSDVYSCGLQSGVVALGQPLALSGNSYFRLRDVVVDACTESQTDDATLYRVAPVVLDVQGGSITVGLQSLFVLQDIVARSSTMFQGTSSSSTQLALGQSSTVSIINITASSLCTTCLSGLPTSRDDSSRLYASDWTLGGASTTDYTAAGLGGATALNSAGRDSSGNCGSPYCLPANTIGAPNSACQCTCNINSFLPACQDKQDVSTTTNTCSDANCVTCIISPNFCDKCRIGFVYNASSAKCVRAPCAVTNCAQCAPANTNQCKQCSDGYAVVNEQCEPCTDTACLDCSANIGVCTKCLAGYSLVNGTCVATSTLCSVPHCAECKDNAYTQCEQCSDGYHLTSAATCTACTESNCVQCTASADTCEACKSGYNLTSYGTCSPGPCKVSYCKYCSASNETQCTECIDGYIVNSENGQCVTTGTCVVPHCTKCQVASPNVCTTCASGYDLNTTTGQCVAVEPTCSDENCLTCITSPNVCDKCRIGFVYDASSAKCVRAPCAVTNCAQCAPASSNQCEQCSDGYHLTSAATCTACTESNCVQCTASADTCEACKSGYNLTSYGTCSPGPCKVSYCKYCSASNETQCTECIDGYIVNSENGQCVTTGTCVVPHCTKCQVASPNVCTTCASGYDVDTTTGQCVAVEPTCSVANCQTCVSGNANECATCSSGYVMTETKQCGKEGCLVYYCTQCKAGYPNQCLACQAGYGLTNLGTCVILRQPGDDRPNVASGPVSLFVAAAAVFVTSVIAFAL
ncbi:major surface-labeled trophozoite antigen 417-like [Bactrocera neohumeralis]|uniref:major surface-labeled trophozoite antigen 417-like n=1 Tax=Bactrocera neohumeralis TaxID=98809 RepID=UPI0021659954|nr:major surface-labeled trophozoite antigen 417-like [Bactrocera neohumeralis]